MTGLDPSGKHLASPEVIHISELTLFSLLEIQKRRLNSEGIFSVLSMIKIWKSPPKEVFDFLEAVQSLKVCTIEQIREKLRSQWPPVRNAKTFCEETGLIEINNSKIVLTEFAERLMRFTGQKRRDFIRNSPIVNHPTFLFVVS
ncbi:unnamed protein product, partial [marine sediment metagenome]